MKTIGCDTIQNVLASLAGTCRVWVVTAFTAGILLFCLPGLCMADAPVPPSQKNKDHIQYETQVAFITEQIGQIQKDLDWLRLKVKRMQDFDRFVPQRMHDSIAFKQSKITSLEKLKNRYQELIPEPEPMEKRLPVAEKNSIGSAEKMQETTGTRDRFQQTLEKQLVAAGLDNWLELVPYTTPVRLETRLPILFASASAQISGGYEPFLKDLAGLVKGHDVRIVVDGYADTDPINTDTYPSNFELGAARAAAVVRALVRYGVKPQVCKIGSTAQYRFDAKKQTEWKNLQRHVTIAVFFRPNA